MDEVADKQAYLDSLWVSDEEILPILGQIDSDGENQHRHNRRHHDRRQYRVVGGLQFEARTNGQSPKYFVVRPFDLCERGAGILHCGMIAPGTPCALTLISGKGERLTVSGIVSHCRRVRGRIYYVGMSFDETLSIDRFCESTGDGPQALRAPHDYDGMKIIGLARELIDLVDSHAPLNDIKIKLAAIARLTENELILNTQALRTDWRRREGPNPDSNSGSSH